MKKSEKDKAEKQKQQIDNLNKTINRILKITSELDNIEEDNKIRLFNLDNEIKQIDQDIKKDYKDYLDTPEKNNTKNKK
tara:strand:- start:293 stop:529 length:237 start_codon:yes stop_codon:yes gene_type:complete